MEKDCISFHVLSLFFCLLQEKTAEYGQGTFIASEKTSGFGEKERQAVELMENLSRNGFEKLMKENELDAMVTPGLGAIALLAIGGHPGITVPAGYDSDGMPFGICFGGLKGTEPRLIEVAYAFEQASMVRRPPIAKSFEINKEFLFASL
jgi:amidase